MAESVVAVLIDLVITGLSEDDFNLLCEKYFHEVIAKFSDGYSFQKKAVTLVSYCHRQRKIGTLKNILQQENPTVFQEYEERLRHAESSTAEETSQKDQPPAPAYETFELLAGPGTPGGYPLFVTHSPAGQASAICMLDPAGPDLQRRLSTLARGEAGADVQIALGRLFFESLFPRPVEALFSSSLSLARAAGRGLRVQLRLDPPELACLPWELLYYPADDSFLALSAQTPVARVAAMPTPERTLEVKPPLRVLVVIAQVVDAPPLQGARERRQIEDALADLVAQRRVQVQVLERAVPAVIRQAMRDFRPHVFHYIGHGGFQNGQGFLWLEDEAGLRWPMDERVFREFFSASPQTRLVVLNACRSGQTDPARAVSGLALRLLQRQIAAVAAMQASVRDTSALTFAQEFYNSLSADAPVEAAMAEARLGLYQECGPDAPDWAIPVLYLRAGSQT